MRIAAVVSYVAGYTQKKPATFVKDVMKCQPGFYETPVLHN